MGKRRKNEIEKSKIVNTSLGNNSGGSIAVAGSNEYLDDSINNIRDLGGNLCEWTLEAYEITGRVYRGGNCTSKHSLNYCNGYNPDNAHSGYGTRLAIYIK